MNVTLFTVGHSRHPIEYFLTLLERHDIGVLADVRSTPFSRFNPQFNRGRLEASLRDAGIRYEWLGEALGARSQDPALLENGRVSYARLAASRLFRAGLDQLLAQAQLQRTAIMCAEREPLDCHRTILVGRAAERSGAAVVHILANGALEVNSHTLGRLMKQLKLPLDDLFQDEATRRESAYDLQGARMAPAMRA